MRRPVLTAHAPPCLSLQMGDLAALPRPLRPRHARRNRLTGKIGRASQGLRGLPATWPPWAAKTKRGHTTSWYDLLIFYGRSDWIRTSDPLLPKQVRYHAAPRSVMGCFVRKRPCFGKGGPSGGRKGRCLHEEGPMAFFRTGRVPAADRGALPPPKKELAMPALPCARERSRGSSVPGLPATAIGVSAGPFSRQVTWRQKKKNPARKRGDFLMGRKMGLEPTATWATTRCSTN